MEDVIEITNANFEEEIIQSELPVIIDFWAEWCAPCKMMLPVVGELAKELKGRVKVSKINVDENTKAAVDLSVMNIPTLIFFKDGKEAGRLVGVVSKREALKKIEELFDE
ncbi:MAG: thioredoxin [Candidatus Omnitrophota bacterium]|nr:thioredoxin [Candidatus Omnitrophota bacterium]